MTEVSPYCMRCNAKAHGGYDGRFHETNEHEEWLERQRLAEARRLGGGNV